MHFCARPKGRALQWTRPPLSSKIVEPSPASDVPANEEFEDRFGARAAQLIFDHVFADRSD
jgi:hypothetical protein